MKNHHQSSIQNITQFLRIVITLTFICSLVLSAQQPPKVEWAWSEYEGRTLTHYTSVPYIKSINGVQQAQYGERTTDVKVSRDNPERPNPNDSQARTKLFLQCVTKETEPNEVPFFVEQRMEMMKPCLSNGKKLISSPPDAYLIYEYPENGTCWPRTFVQGVTPPFPQSQIVIGDAAATVRLSVSALSQEENTVIVPSLIKILSPLTGERISRTTPLTIRWRGGDEGFAMTATLAWDGGTDVTRGQIGKIAERSADGTYSATFSTRDLAHCPDNVRVRLIAKSLIAKWYDRGRKTITSESAAEYLYINVYGAVTAVTEPQDPSSHESIKISPNPVEQSANIHHTLKQTTQKLSIHAVNPLGQTMLIAEQRNLGAGEYSHTFDTQTWPQGVWYCTIDADGRRVATTLMVRR